MNINIDSRENKLKDIFNKKHTDSILSLKKKN